MEAAARWPALSGNRTAIRTLLRGDSSGASTSRGSVDVADADADADADCQDVNVNVSCQDVNVNDPVDVDVGRL
jgi:hypothetical protein